LPPATPLFREEHEPSIQTDTPDIRINHLNFMVLEKQHFEGAASI